MHPDLGEETNFKVFGWESGEYN